MTHTITDRSELFKKGGDMAASLGLARGATNILRLAKMYAPHDKGALQSSGEMRKLTMTSYEISFSTPYARRWEFNEGLTDRLGRTYGPANFGEGKKSRYMRDAAQQEHPKIPGYVIDGIKRI